jgi:hypothetical protein
MQWIWLSSWPYGNTWLIMAWPLLLLLLLGMLKACNWR